MTSNVSEKSNLDYRPEIDGLRTIAVLLVVIYHGFPDILKGGFLGVDIFFVLSGYLITGIISKDVESQTFRLHFFYLNRLRRIFPSLIIVLTTILCVGWFILRSEEYAQLGHEALAGSLFYSNFYYLSQDNYFDIASELKPFLHLWSLSIEEQFYVIYPVAFLAISKLFKDRKFQALVLMILAMLSFALCVFLAGSSTKSFFLPATRWWELILGGVLALLPSKGMKNTAHPNLFSLFGFAGIAIGVFLATVVKSFQTYMGLTVVIGTLMLLAIGQTSWLVNLTIGSRLLASIGKLSYPWYLWHWPILVLARIVYGEQPPILVRTSLIAFAFFLAWITAKFLEIPIRNRVRRGRTILILSSPILLIGSAGFVVADNGGFPGRSANNHEVKYKGDTGHEKFFGFISNNFHPCKPVEIYVEALKWESHVRCNQSKMDQPIDLLLLGDSHAEHLFIGLAEELKSRNVGFYITGNGLNVSDPEFIRIFEAALTDPTIRTVIVVNMWVEREIPQSELVSAFRRMVDSGKDVYVTDDIPVFRIDPDQCKLEGVCTQINPYAAGLEDRSLRDLIAAVKLVPNVTLIETYRYFCKGGELCSMRDARHLLYRDSNHLNIYGSRFIGRLIVQDHPTLR